MVGRWMNWSPISARHRFEELRRNGVSAYPPLGAQKPWTEITEVRKLQEVVWQSWTSSRGTTVPGSAALLEAIERHVDYAGLPEVQRDMLVDVRAKLDSGLLGIGMLTVKTVSARA